MIEYIEHHIVDHCNLRCAGCSHFSGLSEPWFEGIGEFWNDFTALANLTNHYIPTIRIMGGEPLLHPRVVDFLKIARSLFPNSQIQLVTNGLLLKKRKAELIDFCNEEQIFICTSNYGIINVREALEGFKYTLVHSKTSMYNISLDLTGAQDIQTAFSNCDLHIYRWYFFQHGRIYPCCICPNMHIFDKHFNTNIASEEEDLYGISVHDHTLTEVEDFLSHPIPMCKYCNTIKRSHSYSSFQISKGDIKEWIYQ